MNSTQKTQNAVTQIDAPAGHSYAFRLVGQGWLSAGLVADSKRAFYSNLWLTTPDNSGGAAQGQTAKRVAFLNYCNKGSNFVSQSQVDAHAFETASL